MKIRTERHLQRRINRIVGRVYHIRRQSAKRPADGTRHIAGESGE